MYYYKTYIYLHFLSFCSVVREGSDEPPKFNPGKSSRASMMRLHFSWIIQMFLLLMCLYPFYDYPESYLQYIVPRGFIPTAVTQYQILLKLCVDHNWNIINFTSASFGRGSPPNVTVVMEEKEVEAEMEDTHKSGTRRGNGFIRLQGGL